MRTALASRTLALCLLASSAVQAAPTTVLNRPVGPFKRIQAAGGAELTIRKGSQPTLVLSGEEEVLKAYRTEVLDGVLHLEPTRMLRGHQRPVKIVVTTEALESLDASGGVEVTLEAGVTSRTFAVSLSGGVHLHAPSLDLDALKLEASGGVEAVLAGGAASAVIELSGGVDLDTRGLRLAQLDLDASGGCTAKVQATESLVARASGGVEVVVTGQPSKRKVKTSGGADVTFL
jgi:hypothetical protein